jgi:replicative DNA helicase
MSQVEQDHAKRARLEFPYAPEAEAGLIAILLNNPPLAMPYVREEQVDERWFHLPCHARLFRLIVDEVDAGRKVDFVTLATRVRGLGIEHEIGFHTSEHDIHTGIAALNSAQFHHSCLPSFLPGYLDELRQKFLSRQVSELAGRVKKTLLENWEAGGIELVKRAMAELAELASYGVRNDSVRHIRPAVIEALGKVETAFRQRGHTAGIPTGIAALDRCLNGLKTAHGYYVAGRPAMGKSALMGDLAAFIGTNADPYAQAHVLVFSLEMTTLQLVQRELLKRAKVPLKRARDGLMSADRDFPNLHESAKILATARIHVDDSSALTITDIEARTRRFVRKVRASENAEQRDAREKSDRPDVLICVDYLQRVKGASKRAQENRYLEVAEVCQGLSALLKDLKIAGIIVAQLGRADNEGADRFPSLSDLRESGDIEAEAHCVIACHRPVYYLPTMEKKEKWCEKHSGDDHDWRVGTADLNGMGRRDLEHLAYLCILKQREGPVPQLMVHFEPELAHFSNWNEHELTYSPNKERQQDGTKEEGAEE